MRRFRRNRRGRAQHGAPKLRLNSMMDILTVLLLFLLKSFVVEGEVVTPAPGVELPESTSPTPPEASVVVAIDNQAILLGEQVVARLDDVRAGDMMIEGLSAALLEALEKHDAISRMRGEELTSGQVTIQGDRDIAFDVLQKVMFTCQQSGFETISLAVIKAS